MMGVCTPGARRKSAQVRWLTSWVTCRGGRGDDRGKEGESGARKLGDHGMKWYEMLNAAPNLAFLSYMAVPSPPFPPSSPPPSPQPPPPHKHPLLPLPAPQSSPWPLCRAPPCCPYPTAAPPPEHPHLEESLGHCAACVHDALRDPLAVKLRELLDQVVVLQQDGAAGSD